MKIALALHHRVVDGRAVQRRPPGDIGLMSRSWPEGEAVVSCGWSKANSPACITTTESGVHPAVVPQRDSPPDHCQHGKPSLPSSRPFATAGHLPATGCSSPPLPYFLRAYFYGGGAGQQQPDTRSTRQSEEIGCAVQALHRHPRCRPVLVKFAFTASSTSPSVPVSVVT